MTTYEIFHELVNSNDPSHVDSVTEYIGSMMIENKGPLLGHSKYHLGNSADAADAFQEMAVAAIQDFAIQTAGGDPKFKYQGSSEEDLLGHFYLRLGRSATQDFKKSTAHAKIRARQKKHKAEPYSDFEDTRASDEDVPNTYEVDTTIQHALRSISKPEHKFGISLHDGYYGLGVNSSSAELKEIATFLKINDHNVNKIIERFDSLQKLTPVVKLDAEQVGYIIGVSASHFRKIRKHFEEEVVSYQLLEQV